VWFRAAIGRKKNAEARWLLPMICRRGGIDKHDIGAIRILDTTTEFEISAQAAESFAVKIRRPDKEDNIRIEPLAGAPQGESAQENRPNENRPHENRPYPPRREAREARGDARPYDESRDERAPKPHGKPHKGNGPGFGKAPPAHEKAPPAYEKAPRAYDKKPTYDKKRPFRDKPAYAHQSSPAGAAHAKPAFGKKKSIKNRPGR
jgi:ATP-dependent RNA helicase DeaD